MTLNEFSIDKRVVQRHLKSGKLDRTQYQHMLDALPDLSTRLWRRPASSESQVVVAEPSAERPLPSAVRVEPTTQGELQPTPLS
jgi:hypothetical protein